MTLWMLWVAFVSLALFGAAAALDDLRSAAGRPTRGIWAGALALMVVGALWAARRPAPPVLMPAPVGTPETPTPGGEPTWSVALADAVRALESLDAWAAVAWGGATLLLSLVALGGLLLLARRVHRWPRISMHGETVALSGGYGPALVGLLRPVIVMPTWILDRPAREQVLALRHEAEHRSARDTTLLAFAGVLTLAMPWNPGVWLMAGRLRRAVEIDCDRRVLAEGWPPREYGALLIELSAASPRPGLVVAALTEPTSLLERRLKMMTNRMNGRTRVSVGASGVVAVLMLAAACESPPPTMAVPEAAATLQEAPGPAAALQPSEGGVVRLSTLTARTDAPLVYVDGVRLTDGDASALAPETIARIEVLKGDAAEAWFGDGGENGVIQIFTKEPRPAESGGVARFEPAAEGEMSFGVLSRRDRPDS